MSVNLSALLQSACIFRTLGVPSILEDGRGSMTEHLSEKWMWLDYHNCTNRLNLPMLVSTFTRKPDECSGRNIRLVV